MRVTHVYCYTLLMLVKVLAPYCVPSVPFNPLSPNIHIQILHVLIFIHLLRDTLRELNKRSQHFLFGDHLINSHNHFSSQCMDIIREKLMLVTIGT